MCILINIYFKVFIFNFAQSRIIFISPDYFLINEIINFKMFYHLKSSINRNM